MKKTKTELFLELAKPNEEGVSEWIDTSLFTDNYESLKFGNGGSWCRKGSTLDKTYIIEVDCSKTKGNSIDRIRLTGFQQRQGFQQNIRKDIREYYANKNCVMLGVNGKSINTKIEIDHKDGRKSDPRVSDVRKQNKSDFQPLCKAANDIKRQICKRCKETGKRWDAKNISGNPYSFYEGNEDYTSELGCKGCYQYDPIEYRITSVKRIIKDISEDILKRLYPEIEDRI